MSGVLNGSLQPRPTRVRRWVIAGLLLGLFAALILQAPAHWGARWLASASSEHVLLVGTRGTLWNGSGELILTGGAGSRDASRLPGRVHWDLGWNAGAPELRLRLDCCTAGELPLRVEPGWGRLKISLPSRAEPLLRLPAAWLGGLGTPWNTLQLGGQLRLSARDFSLQLQAGHWLTHGGLDLELAALSSRLSTLAPLGSYRLSLQSQPDGGALLQLSTLDGALQLQGEGSFGGSGKSRFRGEASAAPGREAALNNLLNIIGRRQGCAFGDHDRMSMKQHLTAIALACALVHSPVLAQRSPALPGNTPVSLNFVNAEIDAVTRAMSNLLGQPIVVDPRVKGTITLYAEQPMKASEAYAQYLAALRGLGFSVVNVAGLLKVVPEPDAKLQATGVLVGDEKARGDQILTQVFQLRHENANNLVPVLRPLVNVNNTINANPGNNSLVITDYADNLQRIAKIIAALDTPAATDVEVVPIQHQVASELAALVQRLDGGAGAAGVPGQPAAVVGAGGGTTVLADPRGNALILRAPNAARMAALKRLVQQLDVPGGHNTGGIRVVHLKNADAVKLAQVLRAAFAAQGGSAGSGGGGSMSGAGASNTSAQANVPLTSNSSGSGSQSQAATQPLGAGAGPSTGGNVQADPSTNSLIITAPEPLYRQMRAVIDQLDTRRAQVHVEAIIVKVDASKGASFGVQWQNLFGNKGDKTISGLGTNFGTGNANIINLSAAAAQGLTGVGTAITNGVSNGLNVGLLKKVSSYYTLGALANFLETQTGANILSTPSVVVVDNEEAKITVGQNVPFQTGSYAQSSGSGGTVNPFTTVERKDVGLVLRVKTQIGEGGAVRMVITQENSSLAPGGSTTSGPITDKSEIQTTVAVDDGGLLVLGGLMRDEYSDGDDSVPGLSKIPLLGNLFKSANRTRKKSNLMVFLRPTVIRDTDTAAGLSMDRYEQIRATQQAAQPESSALLPDTGAPQLPAVTPPVERKTPAAASLAMSRYPLPYGFAKANTLLLEEQGGELVLWAPPDAPLPALSELQRLYAVARMEAQDAPLLMERIQSAYAGSESSAATVVGEVESAVDLSRLMQDLPAVEDLLEAANDAPIIRMLNALLTQAAKDGASDIHIEPYERSSAVRFRVDGSLREVVQPNKALHAALISRLKIMAELDIAEKRMPQDGRISLRIGGRAIDVRVSTLPSAHGERAVLRLLDKSESKFSLEGLGMGGEVLTRFRRLAAQPHGILLVTGPTGSGKTTTLYAALQTIDTQTTNVLTVEDPIEYELPGIGQTQVNAKIDLTFAKALRAILRQDPDAIMIGEIRDFETAQIAIQASLTGHLVLATLHTNDAPSAVTRLTDMGVEPFLLSSSVLGVLAQRLVRKLCVSCRKPDGEGRYHPVGCADCGFTGYKGRTGVYELMVADDEVRELIHQRAPESEVWKLAQSKGMRSMREDGERLVAQGVTSLEEVLRVTRD